MKNKISNSFLFAVSLAFLTAQLCRADNTTVDWYSMNGGGGTASGGLATISGSIGQDDSGEMSEGVATSFLGGFWGVEDPTGDNSFPGGGLSSSPEGSTGPSPIQWGGVVVTILTPGDVPDGVTTGTVSNPSAAKALNLTLQSLAGGVRLTVGGTPGQNYQLEYTESLAPAKWQNLNPPFVMPAKGSMPIQASVGNASRYFRVVPSPSR